MSKIKTEIIPVKQRFVGEKITLNKEAICVFAATGFFLDQDTYFKEQNVLKPACKYEINNETQTILSETSYFKWHYSPVERSFTEIVDEFAQLFETIIKEQVGDTNVILPLSGGLDSRTQAVALKHLNIPVNTYSYKFQDGHDETYYGKQIATVCNFPFQAMIVPKGYLWNAVDELASMTGCYSEFTHARQMAFINQYEVLGDVFSLGHWGDVLFDDMKVDDNLSFENQVSFLVKKIVKRGGLELADSLWKDWQLKGAFADYLKARVSDLLTAINIPENANAQIRAFKSLYWAPRWTSINLSIFKAKKPITLPYYDDRMCAFICSVPEKYLAGRQIQIAYIKKRMPALAKLTWEAQRPFNLYTYTYNHLPWNLPYRVYNKLGRIASNNKYIQRNWELQFLGSENENQLENRLFNTPGFSSMISTEIPQQFYNLFKTKDQVFYSHAVSMLLTLSLFSSKELKSTKN
ncbi:asparagine synthase [Confluentibacter flavum]|uniref:asparagine synthase (glutamine-hydrolyzing) n=1 Tax=Confluentibacter flavum TaxID=1909700 RepID=A0A2N3HP63_9FLAO|nr:asparagine synthase [Confluentibacter flavum]